MLLPGFVRHEEEYQLNYMGILALNPLIQSALLLEELILDFDLTGFDALLANFLARDVSGEGHLTVNFPPL
jgi:hypothetical protein